VQNSYQSDVRMLHSKTFLMTVSALEFIPDTLSLLQQLEVRLQKLAEKIVRMQKLFKYAFGSEHRIVIP